MKKISKFKLEDNFVKSYEKVTPDFGFNGLGALTYYRTYSRTLPKLGRNEHWFETVRRVVEGAYTLQKKHILANQLGWNEEKAQKSAQEMYDRMFTMKFLPPGRMIWAMGTDIVEKKGIGQALFNCAFVSTKDIVHEPAKPFMFMMDMSMVGVGVGFDVNGADTLEVSKPYNGSETYVIPDSREGWVESLRRLILSYLPNQSKGKVIFDYSEIRGPGLPIKGFGGTSSGPEPLKRMHEQIREVLDNRSKSENNRLTTTDITDIMNMIGQCVVAGNVRRTAQIALGYPEDEEFRKLKDYQWNSESNQYEGSNAHRSAWGWASNNSVIVDNYSDFSDLAKQTAVNGEPGYVFLDNIRKYSRMSEPADYKDMKVQGTNPCGEQSLESYELCCVSGDTRILTKNGYPKIQSVVGKEVEVYNGSEWSKVTPFLTSESDELFEVILSDGSKLHVTDNHEWSVKKPTQKTFKKLETKDLKEGMVLESFEMEETDTGFAESKAYEYGWFAGDGYMDNSRPMATVQYIDYKILSHLDCTPYKEQHPEGYKNPFKRVSFKGVLDEDMCFSFRNKNEGLPEKVFNWDSASLKEFFGGWIDTDGCLRNQNNTDNYQLFGTEGKLRDAQILLRKIGVNHSKITMWKKAGEETNKGVRNVDLWCLYIPSYEANKINTKLKVAKRFGNRYRTNNAHPDGKKIDSARKQKIVSIKKLEGFHKTYCFTEPKKHMGVFGNCLTYQCLIETFPSKAKDLDDYLRTLKFAYLLGKTATLANTTWDEVNRVQQRNRRIGTSVSGVTNFIEKYSLSDLKIWLQDGYKVIRHWDNVYSSWLCVPESIKVTSVKPSGTVSLLAGVNPGCHFPEYKQYIRRVRIAKNSDLIPYVEKAGLHIEPDVVDSSSMVVSFPVQNEGRTINEVSIWEQVSLAVFLQKYWSDNQVSCTVTFTEEEASQIEPILEYFKYDLKAISFLPKLEAGAYAQMPYEAISEEKYEEMNAKVKPIDFIAMNEESKGEQFCTTDVCEIRNEMNSQD